MSRRLSHRSFVRRPLGLEQLQQRSLLAGNVSAFVDRGTLVVNGDIGDNELRITQVGKDLVQLESMSSPTTINNQLSSAVFHVTKGYIFNMGGGNDVLQFDGISIRSKNDLVVDMGRGDDNLQFNNVNVLRIRALLGEGHDQATVTNSKVERSLNIFGGSGDEQITLSNSKFGEKSVIDGNEGADFINEFNVKFGRKLQRLNLTFGTRPPITPPATTPIAANEDDVTVAEGSTNFIISPLANDTPTTGATLSPSTLTITQGPSHGSYVLNPDATISYTPNAETATTDEMHYSIQDSSGATANGVIKITISNVNDAPVAVNDTGDIGVGGSKKFDVAANDTDADGNDTIDKASIVVTQPSVGTAVANSDGTITYTHTGTVTDDQIIKYTIKDATGAVSNEGTLTVHVISDNAAPVANNDAETVDEGEQNVLIDVLANDTDAQGNSTIDASTLEIVSAPANGTAIIEDGKIKYTHDGSESTTDEITYRVRDALGVLSNVATVSITVTPINENPVAVADNNVTANRNQTTTIDVSANDSDPEGQLDLASITVVSGPSHGTATPTSDGKVTYVNNGDSDATDSFTYTIKDAAGNVSNTVTVSINVVDANTPPTAGDDTATLDEGGTASISVMANDDDADGTLVASSIAIVTQPAHGTVTINTTTGAITYVHDGSETTSDSFTYTINDNGGATSNTATVSLTITPVNDAPAAVADSITVGSGGTVDIPVAANDTDAENDLDLASIVVVAQPTHGSFTVNADGTVSYTHDGGSDTSDSFTYNIKDGDGLASNTVTVTITITSPPVAGDDSITLDEGATISIPVSDNDSDSDGTLDLTSIAIVSQPAHGTLTVNNDGTVSYTHDGSETTSDSFTYTIEDNAGALSNTATVSITVTPVNDAPTAAADTANVDEGNSVVVDVSGNDTDADGTLDLTSLAVVDQPAHGSLVVNNDGTITYTHDGSETTSDTFTYTIKDDTGAVSATATVTVTIAPVNDAPTAGDDTANVDEGASINIPVSTNDSDPEGDLDLASLAVVADPAHGTLTVNNDGTITYVHDGSETTSDTFTYTISDGDGTVSNTATVTITIAPVNDPPVADNDSVSVTEDSGVNATGNVLTNDSDPEGSALSVSAVDSLLANVGTDVPGQFGTFHINADGSFTYDLDDANSTVDALNDGDSLVDLIAYSVTDGDLTTTATLTANILGHTDAP